MINLNIWWVRTKNHIFNKISLANIKVSKITLKLFYWMMIALIKIAKFEHLHNTFELCFIQAKTLCDCVSTKWNSYVKPLGNERCVAVDSID